MSNYFIKSEKKKLLRKLFSELKKHANCAVGSPDMLKCKHASKLNLNVPHF